jgi:hypothetical protein
MVEIYQIYFEIDETILYLLLAQEHLLAPPQYLFLLASQSFGFSKYVVFSYQKNISVALSGQNAYILAVPGYQLIA